MSERANHFKLGMFVILTTTLFLASLVVLGAGAMFEKRVTMETYLDESVQGLDVGAPIKHRGVTVGKVRSIDFIYNKYPQEDLEKFLTFGQYILITADLKPDAFPDLLLKSLDQTIEDMVAEGMRVRLASSGLTGVAYLELVFLDPEQNPPPEIAWTPAEMYIPATKSTWALVLTAVEDVMLALRNADIDGMGQQFNALLEKANTAIEGVQLKEVQDEASELLADLQQSNERIAKLIADPRIEKALDDVGQTLASVRKVVGDGEGDLSEFVADLPAISKRIESVSAQLDELLASEQTQKMLSNIADASADAKPAAEDLRRLLRRVDRLLASQQRDVEQLVQNLEKITNDLAELTEDAKANPSRAIFGDPPPREKPGK